MPDEDMFSDFLLEFEHWGFYSMGSDMCLGICFSERSCLFKVSEDDGIGPLVTQRQPLWADL